MEDKKTTDEELNKQLDKFNGRVMEIPGELLEGAKRALWDFCSNRLHAKDTEKVMSLCSKLINIQEEVSDAYKIEHMKNKFHKEHPDYPIFFWRQEVTLRETVMGYWEWVLGRIDANGDEYDYRS